MYDKTYLRWKEMYCAIEYQAFYGCPNNSPQKEKFRQELLKAEKEFKEIFKERGEFWK